MDKYSVKYISIKVLESLIEHNYWVWLSVQKLKETEKERINKLEELDRKANVQLERQLVMASNWSRTLLTIQQKLKGTEWDPEHSHKIDYSDFLALLNSNNVKFMEYSNYGQTVSELLILRFQEEKKAEVLFIYTVHRPKKFRFFFQRLKNLEIIAMTHKKVADLDNEFEQFKNEFAQHRTYVDEQITTMQNRFTAELGAIRTELTAATSSITAAMERKHEELMKMLSSGGLPKDQASLGVAPTESYKAVNELPKRPTTIYKPNNDPKGLQVDDLGFPYFAYGDKPETSKLRNKGLESKNGFKESGTLYYNKKNAFPENYIQPEEHDTVYQGQKGGHHGSDYRMRKLKMPLFDGEDSHGWIYKDKGLFFLSWFRWSEARSPFRLWEGLKRRLLERFQPSQEGTLYEQFLAITQEGSAREYVSLFETLAGQLVGIPEQVMEGTFIKGLRPESRSAIRVMQPEGLNHAMKLAMIIMKIRRKVARRWSCRNLTGLGPCVPLQAKFNPQKKQQVFSFDDFAGQMSTNKSLVNFLGCFIEGSDIHMLLIALWAAQRGNKAPAYKYSTEMDGFKEVPCKKQNSFVPKKKEGNLIVEIAEENTEEFFGLRAETAQNILSTTVFLWLAAKLEALKDEYMRFAMEKCYSVLREYYSAVEEITDILLEKGEIEADEIRSIYESTPRISQPSVTPVDEYAALIYAGRWGIHGASLPGRATFAPGNVGFATFGAPRPMETQVVSDDTWKLVDNIWETRVQEIRDGAVKEIEAEKQKPRVLIASHFL
ncbi:probable inactive ATP-dependent zinc metalloprotease FTSHI 4, chloroplastic [Tanacetum coccineum]